ncbi:MAG: glycosyltransferase family 87 protein [Candidatus Sulfotelmatobacter sp.]
MKTFFLLVFISTLAAFAGMRFPASLQGTDFPDFYCAARMLAGGHGHQLYDAELQRRYQARYSGRIGTLYIHPPFEAVLYLAVAWLPLRYAYLLWSWLSLAFLTAGTCRLAKELPQLLDWHVLLPASLTFVPLLLCLLQGQDSLLLLLLVVLAFTALRRDRGFAAGCWLGLGLFKFQLVLPLVLVLVLTQDKNARSALLKGFSLVAIALAGLSAAISGWPVFIVYPKFLLHLRAQPFAGIAPQAMANFHGLIYFFFHGDQSTWAVALVSVLSVTALIKTLAGWKYAHLASHPAVSGETQPEFDLAFAQTVVFALLVSYHLNPHDLSLLLLPIALLLNRALVRTPRVLGLANWTTLGLLGILFLPPLHVWGLRAGVYYLVSIPLLALFLSGSSLARHDKAGAIS